MTVTKKHFLDFTVGQIENMRATIAERGYEKATIWMLVSDHGLMGSKKKPAVQVGTISTTPNHFSTREVETVSRASGRGP